MQNTKISLILSALLIQSCKVGPSYKAPEVDLPTSFSLDAKGDPSQPSAPLGSSLREIYKSFNDPALSSLIDEALSANADILTAMSNVSKAQAELSLSKSYLLPNIDLQAAATKTKISKNLVSQDQGAIVKNSSISALITYEIDLWGKVSSADEAARATLLSTQSNVEAVKLAVISSVATSYFSVLALSQEIVITKQLISIQEELLTITKAQAHHGTADDIALSSAEADLASSEATLPPLQQQLQEQETALSILLGKSPKAIVETRLKRSRGLDTLPSIPSLPKVLPSELLSRRPDIRAAQENLKSANAMIGVAKAAYFPSLSLSTLIGMSSTNINQLFNKHSRTYELAKNASIPIFDFGARRANVNLAKIAKDQAMIEYAQAVRAAFGDVVIALAGVDSSSSEYVAAEKNEGSLRQVLSLTEQKYKHGTIAYSEVLSAKQSMLQAKVKTVETRLNRLQASIDLFKAMGGGW